MSLDRRTWLKNGIAALAALGWNGLELRAATSALKPQLDDLLPGDVCTLACTQTLGPCYTPPPTRHDITEGKQGLPSLLGFLVVDADTCRPIPNAVVDIWHTDAAGVYSGPISPFCNGPDPAVRAQKFLRGIQPTDENGWAHFRTIYPGWYPGRTPHIHATIRVGARDNATTQFYFQDALSDHVYRTHPLYNHRPNRDTTNARDGVIGGSNASRVNPYLFTSKMIQDRSLVAVKVIAIRPNTVTTCRA